MGNFKRGCSTCRSMHLSITPKRLAPEGTSSVDDENRGSSVASRG